MRNLKQKRSQTGASLIYSSMWYT